MERRELLKMIAVLTGTAFIGGGSFLSGCNNADAGPVEFSQANLDFLNEVGETILPATATPGAKAANVSKVMKAVVTDCYDLAAQPVFLGGIKMINDASNKKFNHSFLEATPPQREELVKEIDKEAREYQKTKKKDDMDHYFTMMKQLTLLGYFTSEVGAKQALRYVPIPQRYDGCIDYHKGDKAVY
ncbi:MAG: gluconate 2-dehydrogenase subunit 3 family protein [Chitinophagaceae bacterium]